MTFQAAPRTIKVELVQSLNGQPVVNIFHVQKPTSIVSADLETVADAFGDWWDEFLKPYQVAQLSLQKVIATDISVENGEQFAFTYTSGNTGTLSSGPIGSNTAAVISWRTNKTGRSFRGRTYIGGLGDIELDTATNLESSTAAGLASSAAELIDALETLGYKLVIVSRIANKVARAVAVVTEILYIIVNTGIDSQRRRTPN